MREFGVYILEDVVGVAVCVACAGGLDTRTRAEVVVAVTAVDDVTGR
jgi:hypothetical protein